MAGGRFRVLEFLRFARCGGAADDTAERREDFQGGVVVRLVIAAQCQRHEVRRPDGDDERDDHAARRRLPLVLRQRLHPGAHEGDVHDGVRPGEGGEAVGRQGDRPASFGSDVLLQDADLGAVVGAALGREQLRRVGVVFQFVDGVASDDRLVGLAVANDAPGLIEAYVPVNALEAIATAPDSPPRETSPGAEWVGTVPKIKLQ